MSQPESHPEDLIQQVMDEHIHCANCGYDLTGTADTCPECGNPFDDDDFETVTVGPKLPEYRKLVIVGEWLFLWLARGIVLVFILGLIAAVAVIVADLT